MNPITPRVIDFDAYLNWANKAGIHLDSVKESRDQAIAMLCHEDYIARVTAIKSFSYLWVFDESIAVRFEHLAIHDPNFLVRGAACTTLMLAHLRCNDATDRRILERILRRVATEPNCKAELVVEIQGYLRDMSVEKEE